MTTAFTSGPHPWLPSLSLGEPGFVRGCAPSPGPQGPPDSCVRRRPALGGDPARLVDSRSGGSGQRGTQIRAPRSGLGCWLALSEREAPLPEGQPLSPGSRGGRPAAAGGRVNSKDGVQTAVLTAALCAWPRPRPCPPHAAGLHARGGSVFVCRFRLRV